MTDKNKGVFCIIIASLFFALMASFVKLTGDLPLMQKVLFRNLVAFIVALIILIKKGESLIGKNIPFLFLRSVFGYLGIILNFYAISKLYLADATILQNTNPFFIIIFSILFLNEPLKKYQVPTIILAFIGALLVIKPQFNYTIIPSISGLASGLFVGAAYVTVRHLNKTNSPETIVFYFSSFSVLMTLPFLFMGQYVTPSPAQWIGLICIGVFGAISQFFITNAYRYAPASEISIYNYFQIIFTVLLGLLWKEIPDFLCLLGSILIIGAGYINYTFSNKKF